MLKTMLTAGIAALTATTAAAHPGHDHTYAPGGESHHLLWFVGIAVVVAFVVGGIGVRAYQRKRSR